jgi:hypothetical protein
MIASILKYNYMRNKITCEKWKLTPLLNISSVGAGYVDVLGVGHPLNDFRGCSAPPVIPLPAV